MSVHTPLNDSGIRGLDPGPTKYEKRDGLERGLMLVVYPSGAKIWNLRCTFRGKQQRLALGEFSARGLSLAAARLKAAEVKQAIRDGEDPGQQRRDAKAPAVDTVAQLVALYLARHVAKKDSAAADTRALTVDVLPYWKDRSVAELTRRDVSRLLDRIVVRGAPIQANRTLSLVRHMLNFAVDTGWIDHNPALRVPKPGGKETSRDRVWTHDEIRAMWDLLERFPTTEEKGAPGRKAKTHDADGRPFCPVSAVLAATFKFRLVTAQRGGEVIGMQWRDVDLTTKVWTIPAAKAKNGREHRVPLTPLAVELITAQLPTTGKAPAKDDCVFVGSGESLKDRAKKASALIAGALGLSDVRGHDLRRTAATAMSEAGVIMEHISHVLNHAESRDMARATLVYNRNQFDKEKRAALETWARVLDRILHAAPAEVVDIAAHRA
jgi:integrase